MSVKYLEGTVEIVLRMPTQTWLDLQRVLRPQGNPIWSVPAEEERALIKHLEKLINDHKFGDSGG